MNHTHRQRGFTIVELLIVAVLIAVLAAITTVAYNGIQGRSQDSKRIGDMKNIRTVLERYRIENGTYPAVARTGSNVSGDYERSYKEDAGEFLAELKAYGMSGGVPVDPTDSAGTHYMYYLYSSANATAYGCPVAKPFYILGLAYTRASKTAPHPDSPGFSCSGRNWQSEMSWVAGGYVE